MRIGQAGALAGLAVVVVVRAMGSEGERHRRDGR